jgi:hypothetical protein
MTAKLLDLIAALTVLRFAIMMAAAKDLRIRLIAGMTVGAYRYLQSLRL